MITSAEILYEKTYKRSPDGVAFSAKKLSAKKSGFLAAVVVEWVGYLRRRRPVYVRMV